MRQQREQFYLKAAGNILGAPTSGQNSRLMPSARSSWRSEYIFVLKGSDNGGLHICDFRAGDNQKLATLSLFLLPRRFARYRARVGETKTHPKGRSKHLIFLDQLGAARRIERPTLALEKSQRSWPELFPLCHDPPRYAHLLFLQKIFSTVFLAVSNGFIQ